VGGFNCISDGVTMSRSSGRQVGAFTITPMLSISKTILFLFVYLSPMLILNSVILCSGSGLLLYNKNLTFSMSGSTTILSALTKKKVLSSGVSPNIAYALHEDYGSVKCLQMVDLNVVRALKEALGGEGLVQFVSEEFAAHCKDVFHSLHVSELTLQNVWSVFLSMLPLVYPHDDK
jgi:hypothetical protein